MDTKKIINDTQSKMQKALDYTLHEFNTLHTGKASPSMLDGINVEAYDSSMKIKDIAAITTDGPRTLVIQPWDAGVVKAIEKAIQVSNLGLNPAVNGNVIRCPIPELSGDRRRELSRSAGNMKEEGLKRVRGARQDANKLLKDAQKEGFISEDDLKRLEKEVQSLTDKFTKQINESLENKEAELMAVS